MQSVTSQFPTSQVAGQLIGGEIPVWVFVMRSGGGFSSINDLIQPKALLASASSHFDGLFNFYLCGLTYVDNDLFTICIWWVQTWKIYE